MAEVNGTIDPRFEKMGVLLGSSVDSGEDLGASVSVTLEGETVVDIWAGFADTDKTKPWEADTITNVWSTTKTMTFLCALMLVEQGELDFYTPVASYWPEFAANGKEAIEVRHIMSHTSGVSGWAQPVTVEDVLDWDKSTAMLAAQEPWWEPGTASGYHALNQGHMIGELVRRISGRSIGEFFAQEVAGPLNADFHIGLPETEHHRVSNVVPPPPLAFDMEAMDLDGPMFKTFTGPAADASMSWTPEWRTAQVPAANGHGNARSVARIQAIVANGGEVDGVKLLSPKTIDLIFDKQSDGIDLVLGLPLSFGMGYALRSESIPTIPEGPICYWGGWGGSRIIVDTERRMTIAYVMNRMADGLLGDPREQSLILAAYEAMG